MESVRTVPRRGADCTTRVSLRPSSNFLFILVFCLSFLTPVLPAQPVAGSITTHALPFAAVSPYIDAAGNVYTTGASNGSGVTAGAAQTQTGGGTCYAVVPLAGATESFPCADAYIAKADASGNLIFGTLLGGPTDDYGTALAVDAAGNVYVAGGTGGSFPTTANAAIPTSTTSYTFAAELSADGSRFLYATYLPDTVQSVAAIAVDGQGNAYVAGQTASGHACIVKLKPDGSAFLYNVRLAGSNREGASALVVDSTGNLLVAGWTSSPDFPVTAGVVQSQLAGTENLFITKLNPNGGTIFSTYLGGSGSDTPSSIQTDSSGNIYVAGFTTSLDFGDEPSRPGPIAGVPLWNSASEGGFAASLTPDAGTIRYSRFIESVDNESAGGVTSLAVTATGDAYVAGVAGAGFPATVSAPQICFQGPWDAFMEHLDANGLTVDATYAGGSQTENPQGLAVESDGSILLQTYTYASAPHGTVEQIRFGGGGWTAPSCLSANPANAATLYSDGSLAPGEFISLTGFGIGPDAGVAYTPGAQWQPPLQLAGVQVFFDGQAAPLLYVQSRQINVQAPFELSGKTSTTIQVQYGGFLIGSITVPVNYAAPGIFRVSPGILTQAVAVNQDGTVNNASNPAAPGSIVSIWGTGFGSLVPPCATGGVNPYAAVNLGATVSLSVCNYGPSVTASYAGSAPGMACGVEQINFAVPNSAHGSCVLLPLVSAIVSGGTSSYFVAPVGATIAVK